MLLGLKCRTNACERAGNPSRHEAGRKATHLQGRRPLPRSPPPEARLCSQSPQFGDSGPNWADFGPKCVVDFGPCAVEFRPPAQNRPNLVDSKPQLTTWPTADQVWSKSPKSDRFRANFGQIRSRIDRTRHHIGRLWPSAERTWPKLVEASPHVVFLGKTWLCSVQAPPSLVTFRSMFGHVPERGSINVAQCSKLHEPVQVQGEGTTKR